MLVLGPRGAQSFDLIGSDNLNNLSEMSSETCLGPPGPLRPQTPNIGDSRSAQKPCIETQVYLKKRSCSHCMKIKAERKAMATRSDATREPKSLARAEHVKTTSRHAKDPIFPRHVPGKSGLAGPGGGAGAELADLGQAKPLTKVNKS